MPRLPIVEIEWEDSASKGGWANREVYRKLSPMRVRTVGFLLERSPRKVIVLQTLAEDGDGTDAVVIPAGCVKKLRRLT